MTGDGVAGDGVESGGPGDRPDTGHDAAVVSALESLALLTAPTAGERARMRARVLDEVLADSPAVSRQAGSGRVARARRGPRGRRTARTARSGGEERPGRPLTGARGRFAVAALAVLALVGSLAGMSLLLARDALPGDALYGVKRTGEAASLGLTFGDEPKALKHLDFAAARLGEISTLARGYPDAPLGSYLTALADFDNDASAGSRRLVALGTTSDGSELRLLGDWAGRQRSRLADIDLPASVRDRGGATLDLLDKITARVADLTARMGCRQITAGTADEVGALPATEPCAPPPTRPAPPAGGTSAPPATGSAAPPAPDTDGGAPAPSGGAGAPSGEAAPPATAVTPTDPAVVLPLPTVVLPPLLPGAGIGE